MGIVNTVAAMVVSANTFQAEVPKGYQPPTSDGVSIVLAHASKECLTEPNEHTITINDAKRRAISIINEGGISNQLDGVKDHALGSTDLSNINYFLNQAVIKELGRRGIDASPLKEVQNLANKTYRAIRDSHKNERYSPQLLERVPERFRDIAEHAIKNGYVGSYGGVFGRMTQRAISDIAEASGSKNNAGFFKALNQITSDIVQKADDVCNTKNGLSLGPKKKTGLDI